MKNAKFSDAQIMAILRQAENGVPVSDLCREQCELLQMARKVRRGGRQHDVWKAVAEENRRLNRMYAEMSMQNDLLKEALGKKR